MLHGVVAGTLTSRFSACYWLSPSRSVLKFLSSNIKMQFKIDHGSLFLCCLHLISAGPSNINSIQRDRGCRNRARLIDKLGRVSFGGKTRSMFVLVARSWLWIIFFFPWFLLPFCPWLSLFNFDTSSFHSFLTFCPLFLSVLSLDLLCIASFLLFHFFHTSFFVISHSFYYFPVPFSHTFLLVFRTQRYSQL